MLIYSNDGLVLSTFEQGIKYGNLAFCPLYEASISNEIECFPEIKMRWVFNSTKNIFGVIVSLPLYIDRAHRFSSTKCEKPDNKTMVEPFWIAADSKADTSVENGRLYHHMIGSQLHLTLHTHLDILPSVSILSRFQQVSTAYSLSAAKQGLRYLRGTSFFVVKFWTGYLDSEPLWTRSTLVKGMIACQCPNLLSLLNLLRCRGAR